MAYVAAAARAALGTSNCWPIVARDPNRLPAVIYYAVGGETLTTLGEGVHEVATAVRFEVRTKVPGVGDSLETTGYGAAVRLSAAIVRGLRSGGRLLALHSVIDELDESVGIYRRIRTATVR